MFVIVDVWDVCNINEMMHTNYNCGATMEWSLFFLCSWRVVQTVLVNYFICIEKFMTSVFFYSYWKVRQFLL